MHARTHARTHRDITCLLTGYDARIAGSPVGAWCSARDGPRVRIRIMVRVKVSVRVTVSVRVAVGVTVEVRVPNRVAAVVMARPLSKHVLVIV